MSVQLRAVILFEILATIWMEDEAGALEVGAEEVRMRVATLLTDAAPASRHAPPPGSGSQ